MSKAQQTLREALFTTGMVQPVESSGRGGTVSILCRQLPNQERPWLQIVDALLQTAEEAGVDLHVCRRYVRKAGQMVFGWHVGVTAQNAKELVEAVGKLTPVFSTVQPLTQVPLQRRQEVVQEPEPEEEVDRAPTPENKRAAAVVAASTTAVPRQPEYSGPDPVPPENFVPRVQVIQNVVDPETGHRHVVTEMPLPHVFRELNRPNAKGKGAKLTGG